MSMNENLDRTKKIVSIANFVTALLMLGAYFILPDNSTVDRVWFLVPAILFVIAGVAFIFFINKLQKKLGGPTE